VLLQVYRMAMRNSIEDKAWQLVQEHIETEEVNSPVPQGATEADQERLRYRELLQYARMG
jgi:hypothetical protein